MPRTSTLALTLPWLLFLTLATPIQAETIYGLTFASSLDGANFISFDSATPGTILTRQRIPGSVFNGFIDDIAIRPANGQLYGIDYFFGRIYTIDPTTAQATLVSTTSVGQLPFGGMDFDPVTGRLRLVDFINGRNVHVDVDTGEVMEDSRLVFAPGDMQTGPVRPVTAIAYTNKVAGATATTLYLVQGSDAKLLKTDQPDTGLVNTLRSTGAYSASSAGLSISGVTGTAYFASLQSFYTIDLQTGQATLVGTIPEDIEFLSIAAPVGALAPVPEPASLALFVAGLASLGFLAFRQHSARP
jgi:Domain of unknown function (DUF4394)/PEP-CTERM motif